MNGVLAYADSGEANAMNLPLILGGAGIVLAISFLAFVLILVARSRGHRHKEFILVAAIFWALISIGSLFYAGDTQVNWSNEQTLRLQTGYGNPQDTSDAPRLPWGIWTGLAVAYAGMMIANVSSFNGERIANPHAGNGRSRPVLGLYVCCALLVGQWVGALLGNPQNILSITRIDWWFVDNFRMNMSDAQVAADILFRILGALAGILVVGAYCFMTRQSPTRFS